jgi:PIN domain
VIYLDSSVALAQLFAEDRSPPEAFAEGVLTSSRLLEYEVWNRVHARGFTSSHREVTEAFFRRVSLIELSPQVLTRALSPFPIAVRTLDGLHLATIEFLRANGEEVELATYDHRLVEAARALNIAIYAL